jgi:GntR family transcriptional regulator of vanillate catabolism
VLEGTAARFAAERLNSSRELAQAQACVERMDGAVRAPETFPDYIRLNEEFHAALVALAKSSVLRRSIDGVQALPFASPGAFLLTQAELPESRAILVLAQEQHRGILDAIERREGTRAEALAREHSRVARRNLEAALGDGSLSKLVPGASLIGRPCTDAP